MTSRTIPTATRDELEVATSGAALIAFLTVTHPNLDQPIRVVSDPMDFVWAGVTYSGVVFSWRPLGDGEAAPVSEITLQNVDRRIGQALIETRQRAEVALSILSTADFDLSANPRTELGTPAEVYAFSRFEIDDVEANAVEIRARVMLRDYSQEPWPGIAATQSRLPGAFR